MSQWIDGEEFILVRAQEVQCGNKALDLLRDIAKDRHDLGLAMLEEGWSGYGHAGTFCTCPDRLCQEAARLLR